MDVRVEAWRLQRAVFAGERRIIWSNCTGNGMLDLEKVGVLESSSVRDKSQLKTWRIWRMACVTEVLQTS